MKKVLFSGICVILLLALAFPVMAEEAPSSAETAQRAADALVETYGVTSVQYALIDGGDIVLSGASGMADKAENRPVTAHDLYGIGSTSKMFTAAAVMQLCERGMIDLDAPVTTYIPEFTMADARYAQITPRMLMNHSSGIYGTSNLNVSLFDDASTEYHDLLLSKLATQNLSAAPGERSEYCNNGFSLLEILVERVSGMSFTEYIAKNFAKPLGLADTMTPQDDFDRDERLVRTYALGSDAALPNETLGAIGSGGIYSTAEDLCKFARVLMGKVPGILLEQSALAMQNEEYKKGVWPEVEGDNFFAFGLGWDSVHGYPFGDYGIRVFHKGGDTALFHSSLVVIPAHDIALAVISSAGQSAFDYAAAASILEAYLLEKGIIGEISPQMTATPPVKAEIPAEIEAYSGLYATAATEANIAFNDGTMTITPVGGEPQTTYIYSGGGLFQSEDGVISVQFTRQKDGNVYLQRSQGIVLPDVGRLMITTFEYQKLKPVQVSPEVLKAWSARRGGKYFVVNEGASSQNYLLDPSFICLKLNDNFDSGYALAGSQITGEDTAVNTVIFRDVVDLAFEERDGAEYLRANDLIFIREDFIPEMNKDTKACAIAQDGFAKYFTIGPDAAGMTI